MSPSGVRDLWRASKFLLPLVFLVLLFILLPVLGTVINSLFQDVSFMDRKIIGVKNFVRLLEDTNFWRSSRFTLLFVIVSVSLEMVLGMVLALVIRERFRWAGLLKVVLLLPWAIPIAIGARIWQLIYNYDYGLANSILVGMGGTPTNWLGSPFGAFISLVFADVWKTTPFVAILLFTGLQAIPAEVLKQARVDGANFIQRFFKVTLPLLTPVVMVALLFRTIDALRVFDLIYVLTGGGPGGTTTSLSLYAYRYYLIGDFGYGSACSFVLFLIALGLSIAYTRFGRFREVLR